MMGTTISRCKILENLGEGGMSQNGLRALLVSSCRFEDLPLVRIALDGGIPRSGTAAIWREA
jgi:hypothetical protein